MADETFYVRVRGKVTGPYDVPSLQKLVRRGTLSRIHEISSDQNKWTNAGQFEDLFPTAPASSAAPQAAPMPQEESDRRDVAVAPIQTTVATGTDAVLYYYTQRGSTVGPVPMAVLKSLAKNGTIGADDLVWRENADTGALAFQVPALAAFFGLPRGRVSPADLPGTRQGPGLIAPATMQSAVRSAASFARMMNFAAGAAILVLINLPWATIDKKLIWWWDFYQVPDAGAWAAFVTVLVFAAATICITVPLVAGIARAVACLGLVFASWIVLCVAKMNSAPSMESVGLLVVPMALAMLVGVCMFRGSFPQSVPGKVLLGICSGIVALGGLAAFAALINAIQDTHAFAGAPGGVVFGSVLILVGLLAALVAGIFGFVGLKSTFTPSLNTVTGIISVVSLLLPGLGLLVFASVSDSVISRLPSSEEFSSGASRNSAAWLWN